MDEKVEERLHKLEEKANQASGFLRGVVFLVSLVVSTGVAVWFLRWLSPDMPIGTIMAWDATDRSGGGQRSVPSGWKLCDGTDGTPDLSNRFLMGVTDRRRSGETGGSNVPLPGGRHSHGGKTSEPDDAYTFRARVDHGGGSNHDFYPALQQGYHGGEPQIKNHSHGIGEQADHQHGDDARPAYYAVVFIMKTS